MATKIEAEFGCRPDTLRERLVNAPYRRYRKQVASGTDQSGLWRALQARQPLITSLPLRDGTLTLGSFFELNLLKK